MPARPVNTTNPSNARLLALSRDIRVGSLAVLLWDILDSVLEDYQLLVCQPFSVLKVVFCISRLAGFAFILVSTIAQTITPSLLPNCRITIILCCCLFVLHRATTCALFFVRVKALYASNVYTQAVFTICWLIAVVGAFWPLKTSGAVMPHQKTICTSSSSWELSVSPASDMLFDLVICAAVTFKVRSMRAGDEGMKGWRQWTGFSRFSRRRGACSQIPPSLSDRFLRDSQIYFLIALCMKSTSLAVSLSNSLRPGTRPQIGIVYIDVALTSIIAGKLYRNMKLGRPGLLQPEPCLENTTVRLERGVGRDLKTRSEMRFASGPSFPESVDLETKCAPGMNSTQSQESDHVLDSSKTVLS